MNELNYVIYKIEELYGAPNLFQLIIGGLLMVEFHLFFFSAAQPPQTTGSVIHLFFALLITFSCEKFELFLCVSWYTQHMAIEKFRASVCKIRELPIVPLIYIEQQQKKREKKSMAITIIWIESSRVFIHLPHEKRAAVSAVLTLNIEFFFLFRCVCRSKYL